VHWHWLWRIAHCRASRELRDGAGARKSIALEARGTPPAADGHSDKVHRMDTNEGYWVTTLEDLGALYKRPLDRVLRKELDYVDGLGRAFIAASPFLVLATGSGQGFDCSPKGDKPGFVQVEANGRMLLLPDRPGNNRIDGLKNLIEDQRVGVVFLVPGANEVFRVNGRARISCDPKLTARFAVDGKLPRTVIVVIVEQAFQHCPKALIRSDLWKAGASGRPDAVPTHGDFAAARNQDIDSVAYNAEYAKRIPKELY
jgi:uncharacterized protein